MLDLTLQCVYCVCDVFRVGRWHGARALLQFIGFRPSPAGDGKLVLKPEDELPQKIDRVLYDTACMWVCLSELSACVYAYNTCV